MGLSCFKDRTGLPAQPHSEDTERQLAALSRQETELTEKQARYLALAAQLEQHKARVSSARDDLTEALAHAETLKSAVKELHVRLEKCEAAARRRKDAHEEAVRLSASLRNSEVESQLQSDLGALQADTHHTASELEAKKVELDSLQQRLRETEKAVTVLEKLEVELEHQLGEEASKHEQARRKAYLRGMFLLLVRRMQVRSLKSLLRWREQARQRDQLRQRLLKLAWPACPDMHSLETLCAALPTNSLIEEARGEVLSISEESEKTYESYKELYSGTEEDVRKAALMSVCSAKALSLKTLNESLIAATRQTEEAKSVWSEQHPPITQALEAASQGSSRAVKELTGLSLHQLDAVTRSQVSRSLEAAQTEQMVCSQAQEKLSRLESVLANLPLAQVHALQVEVGQYQTTAQLPSLKLRTKEEVSNQQILESLETQVIEEPQVAQPSKPEVAVEEEFSEEVLAVSAPAEELLAADPEETTSAVPPEPAKLPSDMSFEARDSVLACPTLKVLQLRSLSDLRMLSSTELFDTLQTLLKSLAPGTALWESVLNHFVRTYSREIAVQRMAEIAASLRSLDAPVYLEVLLSALGLSLRQPLPLIEAYGLVMAAAALEGQAEDIHTGGEIQLVEAVRTARKLLQTDSTAVQEALARLKPESMEPSSYMNFLLCARLKEIKKDSAQLFKLISSEGGKLTCADLVAGVQNKLELWASAELISALFSHIDKSGSNTISRVDFLREITFKTYMPLEKQLTTTRLRFLQVISPLLRPPTQLSVEHLEEATKAWLLELEGQTLLVS